MNSHRPPRIAVIGLGNVLLGDDGFGPFVIEALRANWQLPPRVEAIDAGAPGLGLVTLIEHRHVVILVDAVVSDAPAGELRWYQGEELMRSLSMPHRVSPHDPAVREALMIAELGGNAPDHVQLLGVAPASLTSGTRLSASVEEAADFATQLIVRELARWHATPKRRPVPLATDAWWTR